MSTALEQAVAAAKENRQLAIWDRGMRPWAMAVYEAATKNLRPLPDEEAGVILIRDKDIAREWRKWNAASRNQGSLILICEARVRRVLNEADEERGGSDGPR